ncbi:MAG: hypothetical protein LQ344_002792 [Seirophora lacunosa]|nr:MAG: hypothetical protein LQ344_002792 [Seirophora lacunosa]
MSILIVDSPSLMVTFLDLLGQLPKGLSSLYCDLEGIKLSRHGSVSLLQIFVLPNYSAFLIDVYSLGEIAFTTANAAGVTLKSILESDSTPKVFFDVRNDADALYAHFGIQLQGVYDVQLMENASRCFSKAKLVGLAHCIEQDSGLEQEAKILWKSTKQSGLELFAPEHGGSYEVFNIRPLPQDIIDYCTQDVVFLPVLYRLYSKKLDKCWTKKVFEETCKRVTMARSAEYDPHGEDKVWSPWAPKTGKNARPVKGSQRATQGSDNKFPSPDTKLVTGAMNENHEAAKAKRQPAPADAGPSPVPANLEYSTEADLGYYPSFAVPRCDLRLRSRPLPFSSAGFLATVPKKIVSKREDWTCMICRKTMNISQKEAHLNGKAHQSREASAAKIPSSLSSKPVKWTCTICCKSMATSDKTAHLGGKVHQKREAQGYMFSNLDVASSSLKDLHLS